MVSCKPMIVSGFTIVRNAVKYEYPVTESINSVLPFCDEFIVCLGDSEDSTEQLINSIKSPKIRIIHSVWNPALREGGKVLAVETNKALAEVRKDADWAFYIQADECLAEVGLENMKSAMIKWKDNPEVEGLLFDYLHFYGTYDYVADSRNWYRNEIRLIKLGIGVQSWKDAQGFRINGRKLKVKSSGACIYHYGWVKHPASQKQKEKDFNKLWHGDEWLEKNVEDVPEFDYSKIDSIKPFIGQHPVCMRNRIASVNWKVKLEPNIKKLSLKNRVLMWIESVSGIRIGEYKNYKIV